MTRGMKQLLINEMIDIKLIQIGVRVLRERVPRSAELSAGPVHGAGDRGDVRLWLLPALGRPRLLLLSILCPSLLCHDHHAQVRIFTE